MGNVYSYNHIYFEDLQNIIENKSDEYILLNIMHHSEQSLLIHNTVHANNEESIVNEMIQKKQFKSRRIIIYGKHYCDKKIYKKYNELKSHGFQNVYIYSGGLFEWLCLQDMFGTEVFKTTSTINDVYDILQYKPHM